MNVPMVPPCGIELASKLFTKNLTCTVDRFNFPISFMLRFATEINKGRSDVTVVILRMCEVRVKSCGYGILCASVGSESIPMRVQAGRAGGEMM